MDVNLHLSFFMGINSMSIVTINKSTNDSLSHFYYEDRANFITWAFGIVVKYDWTRRFVSNFNGSLTSTQTRSQPTDWNYRWRMRNHLNATTNLVGTKYRVRQSGSNNFISLHWTGKAGTDGLWHPGYYWELRGWVPQMMNPPPDPGLLSLANADRDAKLQYLKQVRKNYESFQGLTFLGELGETIHMLRHPLSALGEGLSDYLRTVKKRGNRTPASSLNRMITGTWLEKVYGWAPLIGDIQNIGQAIDDHLNRYDDSFERVVGYGEEVFEPGSWQYFEPTQTGSSWILTQKERDLKKVIVRYYGQAFRAALQSSDLVTMTQNLGLGLNAFVPTVWELIPYSFVADYFTNTGNLIDAITTNTSGVKWTSRDYVKIGAKETAFDSFRRNTNYMPDSVVRDLSMVAKVSNSIVERRYVERSWLSAPPTVGLSDFQWKIPGVGSTKWINLAALAAQQISTQNFLQKKLGR